MGPPIRSVRSGASCHGRPADRWKLGFHFGRSARRSGLYCNAVQFAAMLGLRKQLLFKTLRVSCPFKSPVSRALNTQGSYRHRLCCHLCPAITHVQGDESRHDEMLYTNFGPTAAFRDQQLGVRITAVVCAEAVSSRVFPQLRDIPAHGHPRLQPMALLRFIN